MSGAERRRAFLLIWPILLIAIVVVGGIYGGIFTSTEGAAVGAVATLLLGPANRRLGWQELKHSLLPTAETTAKIFLILLGAQVFHAFLSLSDLPLTLDQLIPASALPPPFALVAPPFFY